jgi:molecular chaperone HtpG
MVVKLGVLEDDKFYDRVKEFLVWKNTDGQWGTTEEYLEKNREKTKDKIFYTADTTHATHFLDIYQKRGIEVLCADSPIDPFLMQYLEQKHSPVKFQRVDASIDEHLLDKDRENTILDASGKTSATHLADFIRKKLDNESIKVEAKSLASETLPGFVVIDENQRRMRDYLVQSNPKDAGNIMNMLGGLTYVVNTNNPLIASIQKIEEIDPALATDLVKQSYELSLLAQREITPETLNDFIQRNNKVLEKLTALVSESRKDQPTA